MIKQCRSCKSKNLVQILSLGNLYLADFVKHSRRPRKYPLALVLCKSCFLLQLKHTTPKSLLYTNNYGYKSGINNTMQEELREIVRKSLAKLKTKDKKIIAIDIGANDGTLLKNYHKNVLTIAVEPIEKFAKECRQTADIVVNNFFNYKAVNKKLKDKKVHLITAISCFYDIENPNKFLKDMVRILDRNGILVIQQNYLVKMLKQNAFDNIVHEHLEYYSMISLTNLLKPHNLEIFEVEERDLNGGSFRTYIAFKGTRETSKNVLNLIAKERKLKLETKKPYLEFAKRVLKNKIKLLDTIEKIKSQNKSVYIYGASTRGNTLLQYFNLSNKLISYAVERNPEKWGKIIASVNIPIISEEQARKDRPDYMLVLPWFFKEEFLKREKNYLEKGGKFIFPLPKLKII